ncbi:MAG: hypothetical protein K0S74_301 [Chlamydiales bacterium]|jgi:transposase-like protein|nr:hypothetical protein [Chlamydiales bacterium]
MEGLQMIQETLCCRKCNSTKLIKNGHNSCGNAQYKCKVCNAHLVVSPKIKYSEDRKEEILHAYQERSSLRGLKRVFGVAPLTVLRWLKKRPKTTKFGKNS